MKTDEFGREIMPETQEKSAFYRGSRVFVFGAAIGLGLSFGMGPPLPLLDLTTNAVAAREPAPKNELPREWLVFRNALLDPSVTGASIADQKEAIDLLHRRWTVLLDTLHDMRGPRFAAR